MSTSLVIGSYSLLALASLYFLVTNRLQYIIYSVVILLTIASALGSFFRILHMPGGNELLIAGFSGTILGAVLLIWRSFQNRQRQILLYKLMTGAIILLQIALVLFWPAQAHKAGLLNYPVTAFAATILINKQYQHKGERNVVILFMLQGFLYILIEVLRLL